MLPPESTPPPQSLLSINVLCFSDSLTIFLVVSKGSVCIVSVRVIEPRNSVNSVFRNQHQTYKCVWVLMGYMYKLFAIIE